MQRKIRYAHVSMIHYALDAVVKLHRLGVGRAAKERLFLNHFSSAMVGKGFHEGVNIYGIAWVNEHRDVVWKRFLYSSIVLSGGREEMNVHNLAELLSTAGRCEGFSMIPIESPNHRGIVYHNSYETTLMPQFESRCRTNATYLAQEVTELASHLEAM